MAAHLFAAFLAVLTIAATAAGLVIPEFALFWWIMAAGFAVATVIVWLWERRHGRASRRNTRATPSIVGDHSPTIAIKGDHNVVALGMDAVAYKDAFRDGFRTAVALLKESGPTAIATDGAKLVARAVGDGLELSAVARIFGDVFTRPWTAGRSLGSPGVRGAW